jgi:hypothetical protein
MAESKYGKYIVRGTNEKVASDKPGVRTRTVETEDWVIDEPHLSWKYISQPAKIIEKPVSHDYDEFFVFTGADPTEPDEFEAEVEISMGEEGEISTIDTPSIICLPGGMVHGSVNFTRVDKPVIFCTIRLAPKK